MTYNPENRRFPLSQHTIGPFFPPGFVQPGDNDLTRYSADATPTEQGEVFILHGNVCKEGRLPVPNMILEMWQADANGRFRSECDPEGDQADPDFIAWGRSWTTMEGDYSFRSVLPGSYEEDGQRRAPHLNVLLMGIGLMKPVTTTLYFPQFAELNAKDPILNLVPEHQRDRLLVQPDGEVDGVPAYRFDILTRGPADEETIFFET